MANTDFDNKPMGQILYELHQESCKEESLANEQWYIPWDKLAPEAKAAWENTAGKYGEWVRS